MADVVATVEDRTWHIIIWQLHLPIKIAKNIIKINILQTPSKVDVLQSKRFSHTPDEAMFDGLAKACNH